MQRLEANEVPLYKILNSDYHFRIPDYQRPYSWETEQAVQLLDDLVEALARTDDDPYFLGSIVLIKKSHKPDADVIDGQQRLMTLTLLLAVLRDLAEDPRLRQSLQDLIVEPGNPVLGLQPKPRLTPRKRDTDFFRKYVQADEGATQVLAELSPEALRTDAQRAIHANVKEFRTRLSGPEWPDRRRLELIQMISTRTFLVVVRTPDLTSAHRIFSVMNARGLDLTAADIFKSDIIGDLPPQLSDVYADKWESAEDILGRDDFGELFSHLRLIYSARRAERELLKEFREQVLYKHYLPGKAAEFVDEVLVPYADAYEAIHHQSYSCVSEDLRTRVNAWFRTLEQLDTSDWRPPALWAVRQYATNPVILEQHLRALERLAASMHIRRVYSTPRAQRYAALLRELNGNEGLAAPSYQLTDDEKADTRANLDGDLYLGTKIRKYVLLRLDEILAHDPGVVFKHQLITVEHVLPQNPTAGSAWTRNFTAVERRQWTHRLANLVLLNRRKNSAAQNYDFEKKKQKYFLGSDGVATFALTVQVLQHSEWTPHLLAARQADLLRRLDAAWDLGPA